MKKLLFLPLLWAACAFADGPIQNSDIKGVLDIEAAILSTTGNLSSGSACIASPGSTSGLFAGLYAYDQTNPTYIPSGTTVLGVGTSPCTSGQIKLSANATTTVTGDTITFGGLPSQAINDTKIWVTSATPNQTLYNAITTGAIGGGGGGGSLQWIEGSNAPVPSVDAASNRVFAFSQGLGQVLTTVVKVPHQFAGGTQIKLRLTFYSAASSSGTALLQSISTLVRPGTDVFSSTTNQRTSTNGGVALSSATTNIPQLVTLDLTDTSGNINGVAVAADSLINVTLTRGTDTSTNDLNVLVYGAEVTFH